MKRKTTKLLLAMKTIIGSIIGVGIFGLPFVASQAGFSISSIFILVVGFVYAITLILFSEIIMYTPGQSRISGLAGKYLGHHWKPIASFLQFSNSWGAMLGYIILGGAFLKAIFAPWFDISLFNSQLIFAIVSSFILIGGLGFVAYIESYFFWMVIALIISMIALGLPHAEFTNLLNIEPSNWHIPLGVALVAFGGFAAIPEAADVLNDEREKLRKAVIFSMLFCGLIYILFSGTVLMVTGGNTTQDALIGFAEVIAPWFVFIASIVGLFSVFSSFIVLGMSNIDGFVYDYKIRYVISWFITSLIPISIFLFGARNFIGVIGLTGGILGSLIGLMVIRMYKKARHDVCMPKRCLAIPSGALYLCQAIFLLGIIMQIIGD